MESNKILNKTAAELVQKCRDVLREIIAVPQVFAQSPLAGKSASNLLREIEALLTDGLVAVFERVPSDPRPELPAGQGHRDSQEPPPPLTDEEWENLLSWADDNLRN
jgi:hypothetical protein